jgi:hypothetical protein
MRKLLIIFHDWHFTFWMYSGLLVDENPAKNPLPTKTSADSTLMSESVINVSNLDDFFLEKTLIMSIHGKSINGLRKVMLPDL